MTNHNFFVLKNDKLLLFKLKSYKSLLAKVNAAYNIFYSVPQRVSFRSLKTVFGCIKIDQRDLLDHRLCLR